LLLTPSSAIPSWISFGPFDHERIEVDETLNQTNSKRSTVARGLSSRMQELKILAKCKEENEMTHDTIQS
jgi:hypothetical protein